MSSTSGGAAAPPTAAGRRSRSVAYLVRFVAFVDHLAMLPTVAPYAEQVGAAAMAGLRHGLRPVG